MVLTLTGCTFDSPIHATPTPTRTAHQMSPEESKSEVMGLYQSIAKAVGGNWVIGGADWSDCTPDGGKPHSYFDFGAQRRAQPLQADPDTVADQVKDAMIAKGYSVHIQHDPNLTPPRAVIGYPGGYLQGSEADGFGFQFTVGKDYADFRMTGHCVPGDSYYLNTGKHL
ncbi:hypothetical protein [Humibacter ginsengiterrae]